MSIPRCVCALLCFDGSGCDGALPMSVWARGDLRSGTGHQEAAEPAGELSVVRVGRRSREVLLQSQVSFYACPATGEVSWDHPVGNFL